MTHGFRALRNVADALIAEERERCLLIIERHLTSHDEEDLPLPDGDGCSDHLINQDHEYIYDSRCAKCQIDFLIRNGAELEPDCLLKSGGMR